MHAVTDPPEVPTVERAPDADTLSELQRAVEEAPSGLDFPLETLLDHLNETADRRR